MKEHWILGLLLITTSACAQRALAPRELVTVVTAYSDRSGKIQWERTGVDHASVRIAEELKRNGIKFGVVSSLAASFSVEKKDELRARTIISEVIKAEGLNAKLEPQIAR